jgi:predicted DsbA family dithiol-disulfide isomerase
MLRIDLWSDLICPWCYLGKRRLERALEGFPHRDQVEVVHRAFELDPARPRGRTFDRVAALAEKYGLTEARARAMEEEMEQRAAGDGLEVHLLQGEVGNTFDAHRLVLLSRGRGLEGPTLERLYRAHFTENRSIFDPASLAALGAEVGLDPEELRRALAGDEAVAEVRADEQLARELGITGVPFFVLGGRFAVSGAQPADALARVLERAWEDAAAGAPSQVS